MAQILKNVQLITTPLPATGALDRVTPPAAVTTPVQPTAAPKPEVPAKPVPNALQQQELDAAKSAAQKEGFQIGYDEGLSTAQAKLALTLTRLERVLAELNDHSRQPFADQETALIEIAVTAIARLTGELLSDRKQAANIVRQALDEYGDQHVTTVYLHSDDYDYWMESGLQFERFSNLRVVASPKVTAGGCLIETTNGFIDARVETQIERIRSILLHARNGEHNSAA